MMPFIRPPKPSDPGMAAYPPTTLRPPPGAWYRLARSASYLLTTAAVFGAALGVFAGCFRLVLRLFK